MDFEDIGSKNHHKINLEKMNSDKDHIHILFSMTPLSNLGKFINAYKSATSRVIKTKFPEIKENLWKEFFWSRSYFITSI